MPAQPSVSGRVRVARLGEVGAPFHDGQRTDASSRHGGTRIVVHLELDHPAPVGDLARNRGRDEVVHDRPRRRARDAAEGDQREQTGAENTKRTPERFRGGSMSRGDHERSVAAGTGNLGSGAC